MINTMFMSILPKFQRIKGSHENGCAVTCWVCLTGSVFRLILCMFCFLILNNLTVFWVLDILKC